ncbi:hypothetical protein GJAV_G00256780 [Gymnothorax javanicus]|nr:hypothetical protein GJAV_G00256780 [Gymnothorax javanicus]
MEQGVADINCDKSSVLFELCSTLSGKLVQELKLFITLSDPESGKHLQPESNALHSIGVCKFLFFGG